MKHGILSNAPGTAGEFFQHDRTLHPPALTGRPHPFRRRAGGAAARAPLAAAARREDERGQGEQRPAAGERRGGERGALPEVRRAGS